MNWWWRKRIKKKVCEQLKVWKIHVHLKVWKITLFKQIGCWSIGKAACVSSAEVDSWWNMGHSLQSRACRFCVQQLADRQDWNSRKPHHLASFSLKTTVFGVELGTPLPFLIFAMHPSSHRSCGAQLSTPLSLLPTCADLCRFSWKCCVSTASPWLWSPPKASKRRKSKWPKC